MAATAPRVASAASKIVENFIVELLGGQLDRRFFLKVGW
jgi:hypothetical protein